MLLKAAGASVGAEGAGKAAAPAPPTSAFLGLGRVLAPAPHLQTESHAASLPQHGGSCWSLPGGGWPDGGS